MHFVLTVTALDATTRTWAFHDEGLGVRMAKLWSDGQTEVSLAQAACDCECIATVRAGLLETAKQDLLDLEAHEMAHSL